MAAATFDKSMMNLFRIVFRVVAGTDGAKKSFHTNKHDDVRVESYLLAYWHLLSGGTIAFILPKKHELSNHNFTDFKHTTDLRTVNVTFVNSQEV